LIRRGRVIVEDEVSAFISTLDDRLANVWKDLHEFSLISNLAYQTGRKLDPHMFNDMMLLILYRLLHLAFDDDSVSEAIRVGLVAFAATMFLRGKGAGRQYYYLAGVFHDVLTLHASGDDLPPTIQLWLLLVWGVYSGTQLHEEWLVLWLKRTLQHLQVETWEEMRKALKSVMWIEFLHDPHGKIVFEGSR